MYSKLFYCEIKVLPALSSDPMAGYYKEQINKFVKDSFVCSNVFFCVEVSKNGTVYYKYDPETDIRDVNTKKLWQIGEYTIVISGEGMIMNGAEKPILPMLESLVGKMEIKYKESSDNELPFLLQLSGVPQRQSAAVLDDWRNGFLDDDVYAPGWKIDLVCEKDSYEHASDIVTKMLKLNSGNKSSGEIVSDSFGASIKAAVPFHLASKNKARLYQYLNQLSNMVVEDQVVIKECKMNFASEKFGLESHIFDESSGKFLAKNISL